MADGEYLKDLYKGCDDPNWDTDCVTVTGMRQFSGRNCKLAHVDFPIDVQHSLAQGFYRLTHGMVTMRKNKLGRSTMPENPYINFEHVRLYVEVTHLEGGRANSASSIRVGCLPLYTKLHQHSMLLRADRFFDKDATTLPSEEEIVCMFWKHICVADIEYALMNNRELAAILASYSESEVDTVIEVAGCMSASIDGALNIDIQDPVEIIRYQS